MRNLSLYLHIPFCVRKCNYCDFLSVSCDEKTRKRYVETLCEEITERAEVFQSKEVDTIFFGGGTPSLLSVEQISKIMSVIRKNFLVHKDAEITLEMNPGTVDRDKLECYKSLGINRLSIGLQSASDEELKVLGRIHTWETFLETWKMVREVGFQNVNIDLMSALPGQTLESYEETIRKVLDLKPEHISAYSLIIEEGTLFYDWYGDNDEKDEGRIEVQTRDLEEEDAWINEAKKRKLPDETTDRQMYELTKRLLEEKGYYRYEISNYSLKGYECKHNAGYWKRKEYLGFGLGAASLLSEVRSSNISDLSKYMEITERNEKNIVCFEKVWIEEEAKLSKEEQMEEFMFLGLRMMEGVSPLEFEKKFGTTLQQVYGEQLIKLENQGLLVFDEVSKRYALTTRGIDVSNQVFVEFITG